MTLLKAGEAPVMSTHRLVIGTTNAAKGRELAELLAPHGFDVQTLKDLPPLPKVVEDGETFADNARKKATEYARQLRCCVLTDDSGLCVDALNGRPGVYSARYAGNGASDEENNAKLLAELGDLPPGKRGAHYACHVAVADGDGVVQAESSGVCRGRIVTTPAGANGFGYDPLFEVIEYHRTFGELGPSVKAALSHRARALRAILPKLLDLARRGGCNS
jgi:XTP/dITP diphosphohydrolase